MAGVLVPGRRSWGLERDEDGYREYVLGLLVRAERDDGPFTVLQTPGLPRPGQMWAAGNEADPWVWCRPRCSIRVHPAYQEGHPARYWVLTYYFGNRPLVGGGTGGTPGGRMRCHDLSIENPLLEPPRISGTFVKFMEEGTHNRFGKRITYSSHEQIRGPIVEFERNRPTVRIEQNVATITQALTLPVAYMDSVNSLPMWGLRPRMVKLSGGSWERRYWGLCSAYYTRILDFEVNYSTWDRVAADYSGYVLSGYWNEETGQWVLRNVGGSPPSRKNPSHFIVAPDLDGNPTRLLLNGRGVPFNPTEAQPYFTVYSAEPGGVIASAADIEIAKVYGPFSLSSALSHWFQVAGGGALRVTVHELEREGSVGYFSYSGTAAASAAEGALAETETGSGVYCGDATYASNLFLEVNTTAASSVSYVVLVESGTCGVDPPSIPGRVLIDYYPEYNLFDLGLPVIF